MSPGKRPSHFGANPLQSTRPRRTITAPRITKNFPISRTDEFSSTNRATATHEWWGRDSVEPKNRIPNSTAPPSGALPISSGPPSRARVAQRDACEEIRTMAVQFRDYYETLGVSKTASDNEIRAAFRKLARQHHPDVNKDKTAAEEKFKQL